MSIWDEVVRGGIAFPQDEELTEQFADSCFFNSQSYTVVAEDNETGELVGLYYILHPNNSVPPGQHEDIFS